MGFRLFLLLTLILAILAIESSQAPEAVPGVQISGLTGVANSPEQAIEEPQFELDPLTAGSHADVARGRILVKFRPEATDEEVAEVHSQLGGQHLREISRLNLPVISVPPGQEQALAAAYARHPLVLFAEVDGLTGLGGSRGRRIPTPTPTRTRTPTATPTRSQTPTQVATHTSTSTPTPNLTATLTPTRTATATSTSVTGNEGTVVACPNDPLLPNQWAIENLGQQGGTQDADIDACGAWRVTSGSPSVVIAFLDTGIASNHPDLAGRVTRSVNFSDSPTTSDVYGHGTLVAGIAAASTNNGLGMAGVCGACTLYNVKVIRDADGFGYDSWIAEGIVWAADNGAQVINLSLWRSYAPQVWADAIAYAWSKGAVVVSIAGNSNSNAPAWPGSFENVIAVAATDRFDRRTSFSSYGPSVEVAAPGLDILTTDPGGGYGYAYGTSMSAAFVSGLAGLIWSKGDCTSNTCVRARIQDWADPISGTGDLWRYGRINADRSLSQ